MDMIVYSLARIQEETAEAERLAAECDIPLSEEEAREWLSADINLKWVLPEGSVCGVLRRPHTGDYGFVDDAFVRGDLIPETRGGEVLVAKVASGSRGLRATAIVPAKTYIGWHPELLEKASSCAREMAQEEADHQKDRLEALKATWEEYSRLAEGQGLELVEYSTGRRSYGNSGVAKFRFTGKVTRDQAERVLDAFGERHAKIPDGPYDGGHDRVYLDADGRGFRNDWAGPWDD